jgi:homocysteine S-methyltransferase
MPDHVGRDRVRDIMSSDKTFMTFAGVETFLLFLQEYPLREFCAFEVLDDEDAWNRLDREFMRPIADTCVEHGHGLITDGLVWRAAPDYLARLGYRQSDVERFIRAAVSLSKKFVADWRAESGARDTTTPVILSAELGPRGDGYKSANVSIADAFVYHTPQVRALAATDVDIAFAWTMTNVNETVGLVRAAEEHGLPIVVSSTVETDGALPGGVALGEFVERVDDATDGYAVLHMVNCAHPQHLAPTLHAAKDAGEEWVERVKGLRANSSTKSHEELDNSTELDRGDVADLAKQMGEMHSAFSFKVAGGCCGTDAEHLGAIAAACSR